VRGIRTGASLVLLLGLLDAPAGHVDVVIDLLSASGIMLDLLPRGAPFVPGVLDGLGDDFFQVGYNDVLPFSYVRGSALSWVLKPMGGTATEQLYIELCFGI
jgi:hypothetical protein